MLRRISPSYSAIGPLIAWLALVSIRFALAEPATIARAVVVPAERPNAVLHNPDMGWVLYENYPLDQDPHGSSTLLILPKDNFDGIDTVAVMFSWQDIEKRQDDYDFSKVDFAYDYWAARDKAIQLRLSTENLLWWTARTPPAGAGVPDYVLDKMPASEKQTREMQGLKYVVPDARNAYYQERLAKFLRAVNTHYADKRPVTLIDLRGYGTWGEWHTGFKYPSLAARRDALKAVIVIWCRALPTHRLALSYSYDPDGPKTLYEGTTDKFDEASTTHYAEYLYYSAFDYALTKPNICYRRDGCGGAVHSNERKLSEEAFRLGRGPMFSEFVDGYAQSKAGGDKWLRWKIDDALSLHPNYINLLGYQEADALDFFKKERSLFNLGLTRMGYRLVPTRVAYPLSISIDVPLPVEMRWINRGVGRALLDYELRLGLFTTDGKEVAITSAGPVQSSAWSAGRDYNIATKATFKNVRPGSYQFMIGLYDKATTRNIELPLANGRDGLYGLGNISVMDDKAGNAK